MVNKELFLLLFKVYSLSIGIFYIITKSNALPVDHRSDEESRIVSFNVVAFPENDNVKVNVQGEIFDMVENEYPLYSVTIDTYSLVNGNITSDINYFYIVNDEEENFIRTLPASFQKTYNDFYGREQTLYTYPTLKDPASVPWSRSIGSTTVYDPTYIPTIYFHYTESFFSSAPKTSMIKKITFIFKDEVVTMTDVDVNTKNRTQKKFQIRMILYNRHIHSRTVFKLRPSFEDPLFFRQLLYTDLLNAVGNPVHQSVAARVYSSSNDNYKEFIPIGLYVLQEDVTTWNFIKTAFYGNSTTEKAKFPSVGYGIPLNGATGADFVWSKSSSNPLSNYSSFLYPDGYTNERVRELSRALYELDVKDSEAVEKFSNEWLDLTTFINAMVLEYLTGHWDSYWMHTCNFVIYDDPLTSPSNSTYHFYFVDQDFDMTFGVGMSKKINPWGSEFPKKSYRKLVNREWNVAGSDGKHRMAIDKLLDKGVTREYFEKRLKEIVQSIFNPDALSPLIDAYVERLRPEVQWDYEETMSKNPYDRQNYEIKQCKFTINDFDTNLDRGGKYLYWGLKEWISIRAKAVADEFKFKWSS